MSSLSYNDERLRATELRHLFVPTGYAIISEATIALAVLILSNIGTISDALGGNNAAIDSTPLSLWSQIMNGLFDGLQSNLLLQKIALFLLWAVVGALIYILIFRLAQLFTRASDSVRQGAYLVKAEHEAGFLSYLGSLHDFFMRLVVSIVGTAALLVSVLLCLSIADQQLSTGLNTSLPSSLAPLAIAYIGAWLAVRLVIIGMSLLSVRFRIWYNS